MRGFRHSPLLRNFFYRVRHPQNLFTLCFNRHCQRFSDALIQLGTIRFKIIRPSFQFVCSLQYVTDETEKVFYLRSILHRLCCQIAKLAKFVEISSNFSHFPRNFKFQLKSEKLFFSLNIQNFPDKMRSSKRKKQQCFRFDRICRFNDRHGVECLLCWFCSASLFR